MKEKLQEWQSSAAELEKTIASMTRDLTEQAKTQSIEGRAAKMMLFVMPGFTRAMDHERGLLAKLAKRTASGRAYNTVDELNDHLFVVVNAIANMVTSTIINALPCDVEPVCQDCLETRLSLVRNMISNIAGMAASGVDRTEIPERFHS